MKYLDQNSFDKSLDSSVISYGIGLLIPGTSTAQTIIEYVFQIKEKIRWQRFFVSMKNKI